MGQLEIIDRLCEATNLLSVIVKKQAEIIAQMEVSEEIKTELGAMREKADKSLDAIEYRLRRLE